jgi:hypothetical protein
MIGGSFEGQLSSQRTKARRRWGGLDLKTGNGDISEAAAALRGDRFGKAKWLSLFAVRDQIVLRAVAKLNAPARCQLAFR